MQARVDRDEQVGKGLSMWPGISNEDMNLVRETIIEHYSKQDRFVRIFKEGAHEDQSSYYEFLIDRKHVARYSFGPHDKGYPTMLGGLELAIGPRFFSPADFWSYEASNRFCMGATLVDIRWNLHLLDKFLALQEQAYKSGAPRYIASSSSGY
jgi:hypothetical protein